MGGEFINEENIILRGAAVESGLISSTLPPIPPFTLPTGPTVLTQDADPFYILKTF
ncbi:exosporium leader peptide-containing protein [Bacillus mycoides]|uniref:exosporium leader peptide-containing protein n=1 Tax=Bacillus mycoides TaxID=1405 RepID=UPI00032EA1EF|nr:exosporium leader peptide-containing protein [Bacillus mycoides]EOO37256.1 hypothetical protein IKK_03564 [Bacillus mycoides]